ncbi:PilT/PilU family type 4a pilus ATPase [Desulfoluna sp.]|uniref:PilT/PilU family type 4a pilus ATPase n=1 Tax=Desulfoluna sp. TaxID=2045199 RepID=UPI00261AF94E|nr:PilT/PilU family type 4a pilus ATPase [Desulfoluna sp.]
MAKEKNGAQSVPGRKHRLGELMMEYGYISEEQLETALKRQMHDGGQLGSILIDMGYIGVDDLLKFLGKHFEVKPVNLFSINISQHVLDLIPLEKMRDLRVMPVRVEGHELVLAMVAPQDFVTLNDLGFSLGMKIKPVVTPSFMMEAALQSLAGGYGGGISGEVIRRTAEALSLRIEKAPKLKNLLEEMVKQGSSDMFLSAGAPPSLKISNKLKRMPMGVLSPVDCEKYARELLSDEQWGLFQKDNDFEMALNVKEVGRFRIAFYKQRNTVSIAFRGLPEVLPSMEALNLPDWIHDFALKPQGLIMVCGPAGHGKSTTLSKMVDIINDNRRCNIISLEDPVEYLHKHKKCNVNQREVGRDCDTFYNGLRSIFRQSPDVIVIGEMRDKESFEIALRAAHTGHLVISTVHADNSTGIIERVINMFPSHQQNLTRSLLAASLLCTISQRLIPRKDGKGLVLAVEKFINSYRMKNLIREEKTHMIRTQMQTASDEFIPMDFALADLYSRGIVSFEDAARYMENIGTLQNASIQNGYLPAKEG